MQLQRLAGDYIHALGELRAARFTDFDVVAAWTQIHRFVLLRGARVGAVDEDVGSLHLCIQLDFTRVGVRIHRSPVARTVTPVGSPIWTVEPAVIWAADNHVPAHRRWSAHRRQRHQRGGQDQQSLSHIDLRSVVMQDTCQRRKTRSLNQLPDENRCGSKYEWPKGATTGIKYTGEMLLRGRVAIVTVAATGIGAAVARLFPEHGASLWQMR